MRREIFAEQAARGVRLGFAAGRMRGNVVLDGRNVLDPDKLRTLGLVYEGIGRPIV